MFITLQVPVVNTDRSEDFFDYKGKFDEYGEVDKMEMRKKYRQMKERKDVAYVYTYRPVKAFIWDVNKEDIDYDVLDEFVARGRMFILKVSIDPENFNFDTEEELKSWAKESSLVRENTDVDPKTRIGRLPKMSFLIMGHPTKRYELKNCKIIDDYSNDTSKFYFAMIVEKITDI